MTCLNHETQSFQKELAEKIDKTQVELKAMKTTLDTRTENFQETLEDIRDDFITDLALIDLAAKATRKEALAQQRIMEEKTEANKRDFQAQLEEAKAVVEQGNRPAACASATRPPIFNGSISLPYSGASSRP
jgi:hypothetical protein